MNWHTFRQRGCTSPPASAFSRRCCAQLGPACACTPHHGVQAAPEERHAGRARAHAARKGAGGSRAHRGRRDGAGHHVQAHAQRPGIAAGAKVPQGEAPQSAKQNAHAGADAPPKRPGKGARQEEGTCESEAKKILGVRRGHGHRWRGLPERRGAEWVGRRGRDLRKSYSRADMRAVAAGRHRCL